MAGSWFDGITKTRAEPRAVTAHVKRVPNRASVHPIVSVNGSRVLSRVNGPRGKDGSNPVATYKRPATLLFNGIIWINAAAKRTQRPNPEQNF